MEGGGRPVTDMHSYWTIQGLSSAPTAIRRESSAHIFWTLFLLGGVGEVQKGYETCTFWLQLLLPASGVPFRLNQVSGILQPAGALQH